METGTKKKTTSWMEISVKECMPLGPSRRTNDEMKPCSRDPLAPFTTPPCHAHAHAHAMLCHALLCHASSPTLGNHDDRGLFMVPNDFMFDHHHTPLKHCSRSGAMPWSHSTEYLASHRPARRKVAPWSPGVESTRKPIDQSRRG